MALIIHFLVLLPLAWYLLKRGLWLSNSRQFPRAACELYVPLSLFLFYGVSGFYIYFLNGQDRFSYAGVYFSDWDILASFLIVLLALVPTLFLVRVGWATIAKYPVLLGGKRLERTTNFLLLTLLAFDFIARLKMINDGEYFSWLRAALIARGDFVGGDPIWALQRKFELVIGSILAYKITESRRWLYVYLFVLALVLLKGQRVPLFQFVIVSVLTYLTFGNVKVSFKKLAGYAVVSLVLLNVFSMIIVDVRAQFRANMTEALSDPVKAVATIAFEYVPRAIIGKSEVKQQIEGVDLYERLTLWSGSFASELNRHYQGAGYMPSEYFFEAILLPIPSLLYPGKKPVVQQGPRTAIWYGLGAHTKKPHSLYDPGSTVFSDIHKYGGPVSVAVLAVVYAFFLVMMARFIILRYGALGVMLLFPFVLILDVRGNNFAQLFVSFRDILIMIIFVEVLYMVSRFKVSR